MKFYEAMKDLQEGKAVRLNEPSSMNDWFYLNKQSNQIMEYPYDNVPFYGFEDMDVSDILSDAWESKEIE